jgi:hypothetical protein
MISINVFHIFLVFTVLLREPYFTAGIEKFLSTKRLIYTADDDSFLNENYMNQTETPPCGMPADILRVII